MPRAKAQPFDVFESELDGTSLIEASAGTGKTWTIAALYARLVLERDLPAAGLLVVTYTKAATAELRERIRSRLAGLRECFARGRADADDALGAACLARYDKQQALERLTRALTGFDEAAIHTIHGFCQRALSDHAFESAMPFRTEILVDETDVLQEVVDDFWRRELYRAPELFVRYARRAKLSPASLRADIAPHVGKPYLRVEAPEDPGSIARHAERLCEAYRRARACWLAKREEVRHALMSHPNRRSYRAEHLPGRMAELDAYFAHDAPPLAFPRKGEHFTAAKIEAAANGKDHLTHEFFALCQDLDAATREFTARAAPAVAVLKSRLIDYARGELAARKVRRRVQSYDDLLINLQQALAAPSGGALVTALRERYAAALIDEFQDTDPIQYDIFSRIYRGNLAPVFFVGDPKQAIYSFRGADVFTYLKAKAEAKPEDTLRLNWRSTPELIDAVNAVFEGCARPFLFERITFPRAEPADRERAALAVEGDAPEALRIWLVPGTGEGPVTKGDANREIAGATASEIVRLLNLSEAGRARIGERPLGGGDIAVLVRTHWQAAMVKGELKRCSVASVEYSQESVFQSREALELERVLMAIAEPGRDRLVRAGLATEMLGYGGEDIQALHQDEARWQRQLEMFHEMHSRWREHGFVRMFRELLSAYGVASRLLGYADGERRLTNLSHLAELCQARSIEEHDGMEGLTLWLAERRRGENRTEEAVLRLESDEHLVKIVTVHGAKGLEYPVVFCPFLWDGNIKAGGRGGLRFHDPDRDDQPVLDLGAERRDERLRLARREEFAENLRLAYVALTRAVHRCYLPWGRINEAGTSALAWLFHGHGLDVSADPLAALEARFETLSDADIEAVARRCAARSNAGAISVAPMPEPRDDRFVVARREHAPPVARRFQGSTTREWGIGSFSALAARASAEAPDYDPVRDSERLPALPDGFSIFAFPRGTRAGTCLHAIFQHLDFMAVGRERLEPLVKRTLREYRFPEAWVPAVCAMVHAVLATPLDGEEQLRLGQVAREQRIDEMEFHYPVMRLDAEGLKRILRTHGFGSAAVRDAIDALSFDTVRGFMKGYIDLVFETDDRYYIVDYKSNWLGGDLEGYRRESLERAMADEWYYLQYLLYTVALHRYLNARLPGYDYERHFGGVFYLFVRGMNPARGSEYGVFYDRPTAALVSALDTYLLEGGSPGEGDARAARAARGRAGH